MMTEAMTTIFGEYVPAVYTLADGTTMTGPNFAYIGSVIVFCICLWSAFRLLGMVLKG